MKSLQMMKVGWVALLVLWTLVPHAAFGAISPDVRVSLDLDRIFENPPLVAGYPYQGHLEAAAQKYGLPLPYVLAVARGESFFDASVVSSKGAIGVMQVMPGTAADYGVSAEALKDPATNIDVGVHFLSDLYKRLGDPYLALGAYYCGCRPVDKESLTMRKDCDEYVRYIHSHLKTILARGYQGTGETAGQQKAQRFVLARFENFLDAERFQDFLARSMPGLQLDFFRAEDLRSDHVGYEYRILAAVTEDMTAKDICRELYEKTGFDYCRTGS